MELMVKPAGTTTSAPKTLSGIPVEPFYGPSASTVSKSHRPGRVPYTPGIHPKMYREKLSAMRHFSGFATPGGDQPLLSLSTEPSQSGLSMAFDLPMLIGYDADHPSSLGEVGKCGVSICSLQAMEILFRGIPLGLPRVRAVQPRWETRDGRPEFRLHRFDDP
jgi:methylmalonyl-CoA mutase N-terminal domain/subunit